MIIPLVSIIVPCYKQAQYLNESLQSILDQTYNNWECVIVSDGSPDDTEFIAQEWCVKDSRFQYVYKNNGGPSSARNLGIEKAKGEFILPLDADDKMAPQYIELALKAFDNESLLKVVYCKAEKFGDEAGLWNLKPFSLYNLSKKNMIFCSAIYRKSDWERVGGYDTKMTRGIEDWEFWIAILKDGGNVKCLDIIGFYYRIKKVSRHAQFDEEQEKKMAEYMCIKHPDFFVNYLGSSISLNNNLEFAKSNFRRKLKSKKFVLDLFLNTFFGFTIFNDKNNLY